MRFILDTLLPGFAGIGNEVASIFYIASTASIIFSVAGIGQNLLSSNGSVISYLPVLMQILRFMVLGTILVNFTPILNWLLNWSQFSGGVLASLILDQEVVSNPSYILGIVNEIMTPFWVQIETMSWYETVENLPHIIFYFLCMAFIAYFFIKAAIELFFMTLRFWMVGAVVFIMLPFAAWSGTAFLAERAIGFLVSVVAQMIALIMAVSLTYRIFVNLSLPADPDIWTSLMCAVLTYTVVGKFLKMREEVGAAVAGTSVSLNERDVWQSMISAMGSYSYVQSLTSRISGGGGGGASGASAISSTGGGGGMFGKVMGAIGATRAGAMAGLVGGSMAAGPVGAVGGAIGGALAQAGLGGVSAAIRSRSQGGDSGGSSSASSGKP